MYPTFCDPVDCGLSGSSVHGICQAEILEQVTISFSRPSSQPRDRTWVSCIAGKFFTTEPPGKTSFLVEHHYLGKLDLRLWNVCLTLKVPGSQEAGSALQNIAICAHTFLPLFTHRPRQSCPKNTKKERLAVPTVQAKPKGLSESWLFSSFFLEQSLAGAKSLQSCSILCFPMDCSSSLHGIFPFGKTKS